MAERSTKTLLLVEDEAIIAMSEKLQLEQYGYIVITVTTGEQAVSAVETMPEIDLVLMDINLGDGIDGTEAAKIILGNHDIPILFVSSHSEREIVEKTEKITSYGYVVKSSSITVLDVSIKMSFKLFDEKRSKAEKEEALKISEDRLSKIMIAANDGMWDWNLKTNDVYYDPRYYQMSGYEVDEFPHRIEEFKKHIHPADYGYVMDEAQRHLSGEVDRFDVEFRYLKKNSEWQWIQGKGIIVERDEDGYPLRFVGTHRDITDRKLVEIALQIKNEDYEVINEELRSTTEELKIQNERLQLIGNELQENDKKYRMLIENSHDIIYTLTTDGIFLFVSSAWTILLGHPVDEVVGKPFKEFVHPDDVAGCLFWLEKVIDSGTRQEGIEYRVRHLDGTWYWHSSSAVPLRDSSRTVFGFEGLARDITEQKNAQLSMLDSFDQFNLLLNSVTEGIYGVDEYENCTFCNDSCLRLLGYAHQEELLGKNMHWLIHGKYADGLVYPIEDCPIARNFKNGIAIHIDDEVFWRADGTFFHAEYWSNPKIQDGRVSGAVMSFMDITERKRAEEALRESEDRFKKLSAFTFEGIIIHKNLIGIDVNDSIIKMLGYERDEIVGMNLFKVIHPDYHETVKQNIVKHVASPYQIVVVRRDGSCFDAEIEAKNINYNGEKFRVACIRDISERKKTEVVLKESQERLRFALEVSGLGEWELNLKTNTVKRSERWAEMLGYSMSEIDDSFQRGIDLQHPDDRETVAKAVSDYHEGRSDSFKIEYRMKARDGSYRWIQDCGKTFECDESGRPVRFCGTHADITLQKEKEDRINKLLLEKELILKEVHHRIKNNMNTVSSLLSMQARAILEPNAVKALVDAGNRIHSMSLLYDKLYRSANFNETSVKEYLSSLLDDILGDFPSSQLVRVEKKLQDFCLDAKRLQPLGIIINELITNIMKYAFRGRETGLIVVSASESNGHLSISIQDDGIGMPESVTFESSTGFGLQLVQALTKQLNGTIRIERGNGTVIVLEFDV